MNVIKRLGAKSTAVLTPRAALAQDRRSEQGAWLFLVSLAVFFFSCMLLYAIYVMLRIAPQKEALQPFFLPRSFLLTTVNLLAISVLLHMAVGAARRERRTDMARYIILAFVLAIAFFIVQGFGLSWMVREMFQPDATMRSLYGLTFFLVIVHALHVIGGVAGLTFLLFGLSRSAYDHERNFPVRFTAIYWHFLDVVWIAMMGAFALAAYVTKQTIG